jgi:hypothetical protein
MTRLQIVTTADGQEVGRQITRETDLQGVVAQAAYQASTFARDGGTGEPFPSITITITEWQPPTAKAGK